MEREKRFIKIFEEIPNTPVIDIHTHLNPVRLKAKDLSEIILYHYIATELASSGMPREILDIEDPDERVRRVIPFLKNVRNTSTFWALRRVFSLFDFNEELTEKSFALLKDKFMDFEKNFDGISFLRKRVKVEKAFLTLQFTDTGLTFDTSFFTGSLRLERLSKEFSKESLGMLENLFSLKVNSVRGMREAVGEVFDKFKERISTITISLNPSETIVTDHREELVDEAIRKTETGGRLSLEEKNALLSFVVEEFLKLIKDEGIVFQLMLGVERPVVGASPPDYAIVVNEPSQLLSLCPLFHKYKEVSFDLISASRTQTHELDVIAKNYRNVYVSGFWWYSYYPSIMMERTVEKLQMLPVNKWCAFFSDAQVPEWVFGKAQLVKHQLAITLSDLVEKEYLDLQLALETARSLLYENALEIYRLKR
jgi:glucuronate isomerase